MSRKVEPDEPDKWGTALRQVLAFNKTIYRPGIDLEVANNYTIGRIVLKEDLDPEVQEPAGSLSDEELRWRTRDRLIRNTRQDTASALAHALSAFRAAQEAKEHAIRLKRLVMCVLALTVIVVAQGVLILDSLT